MFANIRNRVTVKKAAIVLTFALVITGSGLSSLASLSDTLHDTVTFNTLSVDLKDGTSDSSQVTFSNIDPSVGGSYAQTIHLTNSGSASATVSINGVVSVGAGSDLDTAITVAAYNGIDATGTRIGAGGPRLYVAIANIGADTGTFQLNAGASKDITLQFALAANPNLTTTSLVADIAFTATHP